MRKAKVKESIRCACVPAKGQLLDCPGTMSGDEGQAEDGTWVCSCECPVHGWWVGR